MENATIQKRQTAYIVSATEIHNAKYVKTKGEWDPNYFLIRNLKVSRANLIGVIISVISEEDNYSGFILDDGSSTISVRIFDEGPKQNFGIGDIVLVIGKPREYNNEKYIVPEITKKITNEKWMEVRKKELETLQKNAPVVESSVEETKEETNESQTLEDEEVIQEPIKEEPSKSEDIFNLIKELDKGDGADIEHVVEKSKVANCESIISSLLNEGEIFEVKPGRLKVLE